MRLIVKIILFSLILGLVNVSLAAEPTANESTLGKINVEKIKILGKNSNRVQFFMTDHNQVKYRFANLSEADARAILDHFKKEKRLALQTEPNVRGYLDVMGWQKIP